MRSVIGLLIVLGVLGPRVALAACIQPGGDPTLCETREILFQEGEAADIRAKAAALGTPARIYEYLRNNARFTPYHGARSNSINTFLGLRGNDVDLSSSLIAMLRSQGIKARYVVGEVRMRKSALANWIGVVNVDLAVSLLGDQGIQQVHSIDAELVQFEHTWVEALVDASFYRGGRTAVPGECTEETAACRWVPLDVAYKQYRYNEETRFLLADLAFDYDAYYNNLNPAHPKFREASRNSSPLELLEEQALALMRQTYPGTTLEDVAGLPAIVEDRSGLLPASLPYEVAGTVRRYASVDDHDTAEAVDWSKYLTVRVDLTQCPGVLGSIFGPYSVRVADLSTRQLTVTAFDANATRIFGYRLDGVPVGAQLVSSGTIQVNCGGQQFTVREGSPIDVRLEIDVEPGRDRVTAQYTGLRLGGYFLVASGGETSNWTQVQRAYRKLLAASAQFPIVADTAGVLGAPGTAYLDSNRNGTADAGDIALLDHLPAQDALTGGLLYAAQGLYYTRLREESDRYGRLTGTISPISAYLGLVSAVDEVEYLDDLPFAIMPGGLLIDLKGIRLNGTWKIDAAERYSNEAFKFLGHIGSALEHEVWQQLTGYDAISTVRGIQFALEQGNGLVEIKNRDGADTFPPALPALGFQIGAAPAGFVRHDSDLFGKRLVSWQYSGSATQPSFHVFRPNLSGIPANDPRTLLLTYSGDNGLDQFFLSYDSLENSYIAAQATQGQLKSGLTWNSIGPVFQTYDVLSADSLTSGFRATSFSRTAPDTYRFVIDEISQHADGSYPVNLRLRLADAGDVRVAAGDPGLGATFTIISSQVVSPAGFSVSAVKSGSQVQLTVGKTASLGNGIYSVQLQVQLFRSPTLFTWTPSLTIEVYGNRFVDATYDALPTGPWDVSDNGSLSCAGGPSGEVVNYVAPPSQLLQHLRNCFDNVVRLNAWETLLTFLDRNAGFDPATYAYRPVAIPNTQYDTGFVVDELRNAMYRTVGGSIEYLLPTRLPAGPFYLFGVHVRNAFDPQGLLAQSTYSIVNYSDRLGAPAGGGYVTATETIDPARSPGFVNEFFTDTSTVASTNNDPIRTPSTADPVSTVTGNNYHDETDVVIRGRGLNFAFTRTYNSAPTSTRADGPLGFGWTHSYNLRLRSNDYGICPNCPAGSAAGQRPENGNGKTASITYTDERGGEHNYLVNETTRAVTAPQGEFDGLTLDSPSAGFITITFRNGVKYVFEGPADFKTVPGRTARLARIDDAYGNSLIFGYDAPAPGGKLVAVTDNLGIAGRTGLTLAYHTGGRLKDIGDWTGRKWSYDYDPAGNLQSSTNPLGHAIRYTYHPGTHSLNEITLPLPRDGQTVKTAFSYYRNGKTFSYANAFGNTESLDYDLYRKSTRVTDPRGNVREYFYDPMGALKKLIEPDGSVLVFENSTEGLRSAKFDALGYGTTYSYRIDRAFSGDSNAFGQVTREQDALGGRLDYGYAALDQIATVKDKRGTVRTTIYGTATGGCDFANRPKETRLSALSGSANVLLASFCWNANGTLAYSREYIDATRYRETRLTYEAASNGLNVLQEQMVGQPSGVTVTRGYTYDALGRKRSETLKRRNSPIDPAPIDLVTSYEYDALDRVIRTTDPLGNEAINYFDANGKVWKVTHRYRKPDGSFELRDIVVRTFDAADRVKTEADTDGNLTTYTYDQAGNVIAVTDAEDHTTRFEYDAMNRRTAVVDATGYRTTTTYNLRGDVVEIINANGETLDFEVDALGRKTAAVDAKGFRTEYRYDQSGNLTCVTDANAQAGLQPKNSAGCSEQRIYNELNRPTRVVDALDGETVFTYDLLGNRLMLKDAQSNTWRFAYDDLGRLASETDHSGKLLTYKVDEAGNIYERTNRLGEITRTTFDGLNRPVRVDYLSDGSSETFGYDPAGNLGAVANENVGYSLAYDRLNRLRMKLDSRGRSLSYTYDKVGNLLTKTTYQGSTTSYLYNAANRLVQLSNPDYLQVDYQYDPAGRLLSRIMSNGARSSYRYDANGWLAHLAQYDAANGLISDTSYVRDRIGHITLTNDTVGAKAYTYDPSYRLRSADLRGIANDEAFDYDKVGNRTLHTVGSLTPNASTRYYNYAGGSNRLSEIRIGSASGPLESSYTYDLEGRLTTQTGVSAKTLTWDAKGRVKTLTGSATTETYAYDSFDYRIGRAGGSLGNLDYFLEGEHLESIYSGANLQAKYFRGGGIDELVAGYLYDTDGQLKPYLFHHDHLTSISAVSGHNGGALQTLVYSPFGQVLSNSGISPNRLKYTGREDDGTGLYYYRARYYDASIGRFISEDPLGFEAGDVNFYAYVGNDPVDASDPSGHVGEGKIAQLLAKGVELIAGKLPRNAKLAGDVHPKTGVPFKCTGCPDFSGVAVKEVRIAQTGDNAIDFAAADKAAGLIQRPAGYTWHHVEDGTTMQLVPSSVHSATGHTGGAAVARAGATTAGVVTSTNVQAAEPAGILGTGITWRDVGEFILDFIVSPGEAYAPTLPASSLGVGGGMLPSSDMGGSGGAVGAGGFVLYPNRSNVNMTRSVYKK